jgi:hypothetical protein
VKWNGFVEGSVTKTHDPGAAKPAHRAKMILISLLFCRAPSAVNEALTLIIKDHRESSGDHGWQRAQNRRDDYLGRSR